MIADIKRTSRDCQACSMERVRLREKFKPLRLFLAKKPLQEVAIDVLGLLTILRGNKYILVITCRFSKLTRTVPLKLIKALNVVKAFFDHWFQCFGAPSSIVADNSIQFTSKLISFMCGRLGIKNLCTTRYHPQSNVQAEIFYRTLLASLLVYVSEHPKFWTEYVGSITFAYNTQLHVSTGLPPFDS